MPGGNYGYHPRGPGQTHWHEEQPGVVPKILRTYFGSPTGMCVYEGSLLPLTNPKRKRGDGKIEDGFTTHLLHTDAGPREVRCYHLKPHGAGYQVEKQVLVSSTDTWFRPSDICVAPDGSAFVADWYDPGVGGHGMGDTTRGRIYRLAPKGKSYTAPETRLYSPKAVLEALISPCLAVRHMGTESIRRMDGGGVQQILDIGFRAASPMLKARLFWAITPPLIKSASNPEKMPKAIGYAMMPLGEARKDMMPFFFRLDRDLTEQSFAKIIREVMKDPKEGKNDDISDVCEAVAAQRELLLILRDFDPREAKEIIYPLAKKYDGKDRFYLEAIGIAVGHHDPKRREIILADFDKHFPEWNDKVADLVWELQPPSVMAKLPGMLSDKSLTAAQRARIVDILAASDDKDAGKALLGVLQADVPAEVRAKVFDNLRLFLPGKWRGLRESPELADTVKGLLAKPQTRIIGLDLVAAARHTASLGEVTAVARDAKQPDDVARAAVRTLGALPDDAAVQTLAALLKDGPAPRRGDALLALGRLAEPKAAARDVLKSLVQDTNTPRDIQQGALEALAATRAGTTWLLDLRKNGKLPEPLVADTGRLLRNSPHQDLRNRALQTFPPAKLDPKRLPDIAQLAKLRGNADHGKQVLAASVKNDLQCMKCHTIHGHGGQVGPDLSMIGKKASRENLFESILYPSKAIADQYVTWAIVTKDGKSINGLLIEETPTFVLLRDANGKDTKIETRDIEAREKDPKSLMPDNLLALMTEDELVDMVEYLLTLKEEQK
jgi:putative heme-binding domain-containing protein